MSNRVDDASGRFKPRLSLWPVSPPRQLSFQDIDLHQACASQHIFQLVSDHNCNSYLSPFFDALPFAKARMFRHDLMTVLKKYAGAKLLDHLSLWRCVS